MNVMRMILAPVLACLAFAVPAAADPMWTRPPAKDGFSYPDCFCTNRGQRVEMGGTACIRVGSDEYTARCGMSLNVPTWRREKTGCDPEPTASRASIPPGPG